MIFHGGYITFGQTNLRGHYMKNLLMSVYTQKAAKMVGVQHQ